MSTIFCHYCDAPVDKGRPHTGIIIDYQTMDLVDVTDVDDTRLRINANLRIDASYTIAICAFCINLRLHGEVRV